LGKVWPTTRSEYWNHQEAVAGVEHAVGGVDVDLGAGAAHMPADDVPEHREQVAHQRLFALGLAVSADGLKLPERGVDGVVLTALRRLPLVGEAVR
jgi:hypothetical protein